MLMIRLYVVPFFSFILLLSGCSSLSGSGPSGSGLVRNENKAPEKRDYVVVGMDVNSVHQLGGKRPVHLNKTFRSSIQGKREMVLGFGDQLAVHIWETSSDGLFSTVERKHTSITSVIDENGEIFIPYVGLIKIAGKDIESVRQLIQSSLEGKAVEPQVQVVLVSNASNNLVVVGDVKNPGRYPVPIGGIRLLDVIALSGGSQAPVYESEVTLVRGNLRDVIRLDEILGEQNNNVWLQPNDTVQIMETPRSFTAFGAVKSKDRHSFKTERMTLAEALAETGGLTDNLADKGGVFLFRFEDPSVLTSAGIDLPVTVFNGRVATIYRLDFAKPESFFLAGSFSMQDKDVIYVANAAAAEFYKFINIFVNPVLNIGRTGIVVSRELE